MIRICYTIAMNSEVKADRMQEIQKLEGLLAYAVRHNDEPGEERIRGEGEWIAGVVSRGCADGK